MQEFKLTAKQASLRSELLLSASRHALIYGGSRSGKTFLICWAIIARAIKAPGSRHAIFRKHGVAVKQSIGLDTIPKVLELAFPDVQFKYHAQDGFYELWSVDPNTGQERKRSEIWLSGLDDKERVDKVLGKEYATIYINEASEVNYPSFVTVMSRLAQVVDSEYDGSQLAQKCYVDLNPTTKAHWTYRLFVDGVEPESQKRVKQGQYIYGVANPKDNLVNLDINYVDSLEQMPERQKKRFFDGEFTADVDEALWKRSYIQRIYEKAPDMQRIVVAIDPAVSTEIGSDETGIIVCAVDGEGNGYVLDDASGRHAPEEWAAIAVNLYKHWEADKIIAEVNQGGDMVEATLRAREASVSYEAVRATRGKYIRAEPIAALYARHKIYHVGEFDNLEDQLCSMTVDFDRKSQGYSPDRVDALVWGFTYLFPKMTNNKSRESRQQWLTPRGDMQSAELYDPLEGL